MKTPEKVGEPVEVLPAKFGRTLMDQRFRRPDGEEYDHRIYCDRKGAPSIVMPVTKDLKVIAIKEFKHGAGQSMLQFPGGAPGKDSPVDAALRELREETGYTSHHVIILPPRGIWFEPANSSQSFHGFLALGCKKVGNQELEPNEFAEVVEIPVSDWYQMCFRGEISVSSALAISLLAIPHIH